LVELIENSDENIEYEIKKYNVYDFEDIVIEYIKNNTLFYYGDGQWFVITAYDVDDETVLIDEELIKFDVIDKMEEINMYKIIFYGGDKEILGIVEIHGYDDESEYDIASRKSFDIRKDAVDYAKELAKKNNIKTKFENPEDNYLD